MAEKAHAAHFCKGALLAYKQAPLLELAIFTTAENHNFVLLISQCYFCNL
jgi:hypothetical protein